MNLAIDIGNSYIHLAVFNRSKITAYKTIPLDSNVILINWFKSISKRYNICNVGLSSVVPKQNKFITQTIKKLFKLKPLIINYKSKLPIKVKVKNPYTLGSDRVCNAVFGYINSTRSNSLIIDLGTANKFDLVLKNGNYVGGIIAPGLKLSAAALNINTAKLPLLNIEKLSGNAPIIGKNTFQAVQSGLLNYMKSATEGIVKEVKNQYPGNLKVFLTGGSAKFIKNKVSFNYIFTENTVLFAINYILNKQKI